MSTPQRKGPEDSPAASPAAPPSPESAVIDSGAAPRATAPRELGGVSGPDPTRFGDWEKNGRCIDF